MTALTERQLDELNGPRPVSRGWYARPSGEVFEVHVFGADGGPYVGIHVATGRIVIHGASDPTSWLSPTKAEAIEKVLEAADAELTRARAAVDRLRGELAAAE